MTDKPARTLAVRPPSAPQAPRKRRKPGITAKVQEAIRLMVWEGLKRGDAAERAGLRDNSLYIALRRSDVRRHYLDEIRILRTSELAKNVHTLADVRDNSGNDMARVAAAKALDQQVVVDNSQGEIGQVWTPGVVILVGNAPYSPLRDVTPTPPQIDAQAEPVGALLADENGDETGE
jgi:hypothetical protein